MDAADNDRKRLAHAILLANRDEGDSRGDRDHRSKTRRRLSPCHAFTPARLEREIEEQRAAARRSLEKHDRAPIMELGVVAERVDGQRRRDLADDGFEVSRLVFLRSFSTKGPALLGQQNSLVSLDSYAFPTHEKSVTLSAATTKQDGGDEPPARGRRRRDALSPSNHVVTF